MACASSYEGGGSAGSKQPVDSLNLLSQYCNDQTIQVITGIATGHLLIISRVNHAVL